LLARLSASIPGWAVWKGVEGAFDGSGDVDAVGTGATWPAVTRMYEGWALDRGASAVIMCHHVPGVVHLLALFPERRWIAELDVCDEFYWRGSVLFTAAGLSSLTVCDPRGFRRLRPGASGLLLLLMNGVLRGGGSDVAAIREKNIERLLRQDPLGVSQAAGLLGGGRKSALKLSEAVREGRWRRRSSLLLEARSLLRSGLEPSRTAARIGFRLSASRRCPVLVMVREHRAMPEHVDEWLEDVDSSHRVIRA
jgi:hypothetical protein